MAPPLFEDLIEYEDGTAATPEQMAKDVTTFLMYVADSYGYLGYVVVMITRNLWTTTGDFLQFFIWLCWLATCLSLVCLLLSWRYFAVRGSHASVSPAAEGIA